MTAADPRGAPAPARIRRASGLANDERILDAAIEAVAATGADALSLRDVAARAGFTYGALYGRYGNAADLLADLWERRLEAELGRLVADCLATRDRAPARTAGGLFRPTPVRRALVETMIVSSRVDDLADVVPDGTRTILDDAELLPLGPTDAARARDLTLVALALGSIAHGPLDGPFESLAGVAIGWLQADGAWSGPAPEPARPAGVTFLSPDDPEDREALLLDATLRVIARSGFAGATLRRIGRATGRTSRIVYHAYGSHHRLLHEIIRRVAETSRQASTAPGAYTDPVLHSARVAGLIGVGGRTRRRLLLEFNLGALHDATSGALVVDADAAGYAARADRLAPPGTAAHASVVALMRALRNAQFGLALLADTAGGLESGDWRHGPGALMRGGLAEAGVREGS